MGRTRVLHVVAGIFVIQGLCLAQQQVQPLTVKNIRNSIYVMQGGSGANTGVYAGEKETVVIDVKMTADAEKQVIEEIHKLTPNPVTRIVITHSDGDHVNGLNAFREGLKIYAHPLTRRDMEQAAAAPNMQYLRNYLPNEMCTACAPSNASAMVIRVGDETIRLYYFGPAHTSGDYVVLFPAERVAFIGDLAFVGRDPLIHRQKGGTSSGYISLLQSLQHLEADTFIPGHNDPLTKQDLQALYNSMTGKREKVKALVSQGKSLDEVKQAMGVADPPGSRPRFPSLAEVMYLELTSK